jgi:hypothetical protein
MKSILQKKLLWANKKGLKWYNWANNILGWAGIR